MARETLRDFLQHVGLDTVNPEGMIGVTAAGKSLDGETYANSDPSTPGGDLRNEDKSGLGVDPHTGFGLINFDAESVPEKMQNIASRFLRFVANSNGNFYEFSPLPAMGYAGARGEHLRGADEFILSDPHVVPGTLEDSLLDSNSNSKYFDDPLTGTIDEPDDELDQIISKVDGEPRGPGAENGPFKQKRGANELLKDVYVSEDGEGPTDFVVKHSVEALKRKSRFSMDNDYPDNPGTAELSNNYQFVRGDQDYHTSLRKLKNAGASQLLKASGYDLSIYPENDDGFIENLETKILDPLLGPLNEFAVQMPSALPGPEVEKLSSDLSRGMNATGVPKVSETQSVRDGTGQRQGRAKSFGVTYNQAIRFEDQTATHRVKTAIRMIAVYTILDELYTDIISVLANEDQAILKDEISKIAASPNVAHAGAEILGLCRKSNKFISNNYLFENYLTPTDFGYGDCFRRGIEVVFGKEPDNTFKAAANLTKVYDSPGFWLAISNSVMKKTFLFSDTLERLTSVPDDVTLGVSSRTAVRNILEQFGDMARIANIFAVIGEKSFHWQNAATNEDNLKKSVTNVRDVDSLDDLPGNRVGKSRKKNSGGGNGALLVNANLGSETTLAWEQSDVPSMYLLPLNIIRAVGDLNNSKAGASPSRGMLGSRLVRNTYTGLGTDGTGARIPSRVVKILEDRLGAEYVPFYFHDLRTNEIISFHAFLHQLTDSITPSYNATQGFGRLDPVQTYQSTTRQLQVGFTVYATNKQDFDDMWYKINKLVTLLYPQWTQGQLVQAGDMSKGVGMSGVEGARFVQPFTQTIGASPLIRLRVGDVVKSNYSRFALARTFGIGDQGVEAQAIGSGNFLQNLLTGPMRVIRDVLTTIAAAVFGSPQSLLQATAGAAADGIADPGGRAVANGLTDAGAEILAMLCINGFVNPLMASGIINRLRDPNEFDAGGYDGGGIFAMNPIIYLNPNMVNGYRAESGVTYYTQRRVIGKVTGTTSDDNGKKVYEVEVIDNYADKDLAGEVLFVRHEDIWNDPNDTFAKSLAGLIFLGASLDVVGLIDTASSNTIRSGGSGAVALQIVSAVAALLLENHEAKFMRPEFNPYTRAFHTTRGRGLAGVMGGISFDWLDDFPWEVDFNSRAPIGCKISFNFDVIHDIPPGLDHTGYNRAPLYNVGEIMRNVAGDVYDDRVSKEEIQFRKGGSNNLRKGRHVTKTGKK